MSRESGPNFGDCLTVSEAAEFLGVSSATLRNWDRTGKLKPRRHPQNGYRIYLHEDLQAVLRSADLWSGESLAPQVAWTEILDSEHFVQFYEDDNYLTDSVSGFVASALNTEAASVVIATPPHRNAIQRKLVVCGVDVADRIETGRYVVLDASDTLSKFMIDGAPNQKRFNETVGKVISRLADGGRRIHAFGEMVALLWAAGNRDAAIQLEELWNDLAKRHRFALFCAYPITGFDDESCVEGFNGICSCHSRVIPAESYAANGSLNEQHRAISMLQQKAQSLEAEIEHRKRVETILYKRERELSDFFENAVEGLHKVGPDGTILWANKAEYILLGYSADEYIGHSITEFHADSDVIANILSMLQRGETLENFPARLRCKNGAIKHVLITSNAFFDDGKFAYTRCFTRDVTQQYIAESKLRDADRRKDEFLATLAHELRNPLAPIRNSLDLLQVTNADAKVIGEARSIIDRQVCQLTRLVEDLLDVSRITKDKIALRKKHVEFATIINNAIETSSPVIRSAGHELIVNLPDEPILLEADSTRLAQVFSNLLNNSAKYTDPGGRISIDAGKGQNEVVVSVKDNGIGIPCEALAHIFDVFRQVEPSIDRAQGGLGIGLTLVRRFVELHGGTVQALSEGLGKGSEFIVRLPIASAASRRAKNERAVKHVETSKRRFLVVDDNKDAGDTFSKLLQIRGHDVRTARDGLEAVEFAADFRPEVILMDVGMPKLDGYEATRRIRQMPGGEDIIIIALTGWGQAEDKQRSTDAGCSAHLVKPIDLVALEQVLADIDARQGVRSA